jgi:small-conductance mechanosensitive channel
MDLRHQERLASLRELIVGGRRSTPQGVASRDEDHAADQADEERTATGPEARDWTETLDLVHGAASRLAATDERVRDLETELRDLSDSAAEEIQRLRAEVVDLQGRLEAAEARRTHAEDWLRRLHASIVEQFAPQLGPSRDSETPISAAS